MNEGIVKNYERIRLFDLWFVGSALQLSLKFIFSLPSLFLILKVYISSFLPLVICFYLLKGPIPRGGCWRSHFPTVFFLLYFGYFPALSTEERRGEEQRECLCPLSWRVLKPNSWTYNHVEVSGHNLESSQAWGFCMDFLNHREGGYGFLSGFPPFSFTETVRGCVSLKN
jgi:hypothetical protein